MLLLMRAEEPTVVGKKPHESRSRVGFKVFYRIDQAYITREESGCALPRRCFVRGAPASAYRRRATVAVGG